MSCRGGYCPRLQANKLDGQLKTLDATNLPFPNVRYKQRFFAREHYTISVENIFSSGTIFPPAAMKGSLSANQQTQENNGPVSRVPACPRVRVSRHNAASHKVCRPMMSGKSFEDSAQIFSCALLRMLKQYLHLKLKMSFRGNCTNIFIMQENILEIFFN